MGRRGRPKHPDILTPREWEVLALLREGLSNEEIAERLSISLAGAKYHVSEILSKLGVSSRDEAARWSPERRPWWAGALAPVTFVWRKASASWVAGAAAVGVFVLIVAGIGVLVWGLVRTGEGGAASSTIVFLATINGASDVYLVDLDGENLTNLTPQREGYLFGEGWSPDGSAIAVTKSHESQTDVHLIRPDGSDVSNLTNSASLNETFVSWSPTGEEILYGFFTEGTGEYWTMHTDGTDRRMVLAECNECEVMDWSPDGSRLLGSRRQDGTAQLFTMLADGTRIQVVTDLDLVYARAKWSPDGQAIAFVDPGRSGTERGDESIWLIRPDGTERRLIHSADSGAGSFSWSPDSTRLVVAGDSSITVLDVQTGAAKVIARADQVYDVRWSPRGDNIAYTGYSGEKSDVFVVNPTGGTPVNVSQGRWNDGGPEWSPDGSRLLLRTDRNSRDGLYSVSADNLSSEWLVPTNPNGLTEQDLDAIDVPGVEGGCVEYQAPPDPSFTGCLSPDGSLAAGIIHRNPPASSELVIMGISTGERQRLSLGAISPEGSPPAWSPDGQRIAFYGLENRDPLQYNQNENWSVYVLDVEKERVTRLTQGDSIGNPAPSLLWSSDGEQIYFIRGTECPQGCSPGYPFRIKTDGSGEAEQISDLRVSRFYGFMQ